MKKHAQILRHPKLFSKRKSNSYPILAYGRIIASAPWDVGAAEMTSLPNPTLSFQDLTPGSIKRERVLLVSRSKTLLLGTIKLGRALGRFRNEECASFSVGRGVAQRLHERWLSRGSALHVLPRF
jgi:hypothetical protein